MNKNNEEVEDLIKVTEAAHILGFKQRNKVDKISNATNVTIQSSMVIFAKMKPLKNKMSNHQ